MHCNTNNPKHKKVSHSDCQTLLRKRQKLCCRRLSLFVVFPLSSLDVSPRIIAARRNRERDIHSGRDTNYDTFQFSSELRQKGNEALDTRQTQEEEKFNQLRRRVRRLSFQIALSVSSMASSLFCFLPMSTLHTLCCSAGCTHNCTIPGPFYKGTLVESIRTSDQNPRKEIPRDQGLLLKGGVGVSWQNKGWLLIHSWE